MTVSLNDKDIDPPETSLTRFSQKSKTLTGNLKPKLIVFDLDYTLWPFWCDTHVTPPVRPTAQGEYVLDKYGDQFGFYSEVRAIFREIKQTKGMEVCAASRTQSPNIAQSLLSMLKIDQEPISTYFAFTAWGTGSKIQHFQELSLHTGINFEDMLFFDDENRNRDVETQLGVCFVEVPSGITLKLFHDGIEKWQKHILKTRSQGKKIWINKCSADSVDTLEVFEPLRSIAKIDIIQIKMSIKSLRRDSFFCRVTDIVSRVVDALKTNIITNLESKVY